MLRFMKAFERVIVYALLVLLMLVVLLATIELAYVVIVQAFGFDLPNLVLDFTELLNISGSSSWS